MNEYNLIIIGSGSGLDLARAAKEKDESLKIAIIDKDAPGGICLTRGCIPSKLLIYPADLVRLLEKISNFGIEIEIKQKKFEAVMNRMRSIIDRDIQRIKNGLKDSELLDYYDEIAEFIAPYTVKVGGETLHSDKFFVSSGSRPLVPPIEGLEKTGFLTSDSVLKISRLPKSIAFIGGGYIAAEYGHFFSAMGSEVTIIEMTDRYLPSEEPEISALATRKMKEKAKILTGHKVVRASATSNGKSLTLVNQNDNSEAEIETQEIFVAAGRIPNSDLLNAERAEIETDKKGFIKVNEFLETSQPNIWAVGDANGNYLFKHVANYEAEVVYHNAILKKKMKADYHAVPHAVFTHPEIASVAMKEQEAIEKYGEENLLIGFYKYADTARGESMEVKDGFVKVIVEKEHGLILGAHIIGPEASVLIQEIVNVMYTKEKGVYSINSAMHIHPALSEVVDRACKSMKTVDIYRHMLTEHEGLL